MYDSCSSLDSCIFVQFPVGGSSQPPCTAQNNVPESRCKAPNWEKYPGVRSNEWKWAERGGSWVPQLGSHWDTVSTAEGRTREKCACRKKENPLHLADEVSQVNSKLRSIQAGVHFFVQHFLLAAVKRLIYSQSVFHSSFSPSLPYPFLKDCSGEYTGSIKLF